MVAPVGSHMEFIICSAISLQFAAIGLKRDCVPEGAEI